MRSWGTKGLLIGAVAAAVIGVGAMALAAARTSDTGAATMKSTFVAAADETQGERAWEGRGCGAAGGKMGELMGNEEFRADMFALRQERLDDMKALWDKYGDDPTSDAAREAVQELRDEHRADMQQLFEKYGVEWDGLDGLQGRGAGRGGCGGFMGGGFGDGRGMMSPGGTGSGTSGPGASTGGMMGAGGYSL